MNRPYVGILVGEKLYQSIPSGRTGHENLSFYVESAQRYGFVPCFIRIGDLMPGQTQVKAYVPAHGKYVHTTVPVPSVVHNRGIFTKKSDERKLAALTAGGLRLYNRRNRYGKLMIHRLLMEDHELRPHLPGTVAASPSALRMMMDMYDALIIKPDSSSIGRGVMKLERRQSGWRLTYPASVSTSNRSWKTLLFRGANIPALLLGRMRRQRYIIQQRLPLATYQGRPFDIRVSVQRGREGHWKVTGMVAKVAARGAYITNVAQGGSVCALERILQEEYPELPAAEIMNGIAMFSLHIVDRLSAGLPELADVGLDIAITRDGFPMFIECNGKDQRYSFHLAGMHEAWKATYDNPMGYARYLLDQLPGESSRSQ